MKGIETELERLKRRQIIKNQRLEGTIDALCQDIDHIIIEFDNKESEPNFKPEAYSSAFRGLNTRLRQSCEEVIRKKNVRALQNIHKEHFTYLSKLGKTIEKELVEECTLPLFEEMLGKRDLLEFLHFNSSTEPHIRIRDTDCSSLAGKLLQIQTLIEQKRYQEAFRVSISKNSEEGLLHENLSFELMKLTFLDLINEGKRLESINFLQRTYQDNLFDFSVHYGEMISISTLKEPSSLPKRLAQYNLEGVLENCNQMISKRIRKTLGLPEVPPLQEIVCAGLIAFPELSKEMSGLDSLNLGDDLEVQVHLPGHMVHHSVIYCPITREFCHEDTNRALHQHCGHVVGEHSVRKMMESNKKNKETDSFKCPTCPNQQRLSTMKEVHY
jgi:hypothetical protein